MTQRFYGCNPDKFDGRDLMFADHPLYMANRAMKLPAFTTNRLARPIPIRDQGAEGSCTGHGVARAVQRELLTLGKPAPNFSPAFVYFEERLIENDTTQDAGAAIRDGIKVVANTGVCTEAAMPYQAGQFARPPSPAAIAEAAGHKVAAYHRITTVHQAKVALNVGKPVVIGFTVYASFETSLFGRMDAGPEKIALMPMPHRKESVLGGHCVCVEDYADEADVSGGGALIAANSWGPGWETGGYFAMPYAFWAGGRVSDCWAIDLA